MDKPHVFFMIVSCMISIGKAQDYDSVDGPPLSMDQLIQNAAESSSAMDFIQPDDSVLVELDMRFSRDEWDRIKNSRLDPEFGSSTDDNGMTRRRLKRKAVREKRWPNKEVPYVLSNIFSATDRSNVMAAFNEYHRYTCLSFRPATSRDTNKIAIQNGGGCSSNVGMTGDTQDVYLARGCRKKGVIIHELGHAIGFYHEHTRPDRNEYVTILKDNIPPKYLSNFRRFGTDVINDLGVEYDYNSVMHYSGTAFSANGRDTIKTKDQTYQKSIGQRMGLSFHDVKLASLMYECNSHCPRKLKCPGEGFQGKNCKCWCRGNPVKPCEEINQPLQTGADQTQIPCSVPHVPNSVIYHNSRRIENPLAEFSPGEEIQIGCEATYTRWGKPSLVCRDDGTWSDPNPECAPEVVPQYCELTTIPNGKYEDEYSYDEYLYEDYYYDTVDGLSDAVTKIPIGTRQKVTCNDGYVINGPEVVVCMENGQLSSRPTCNREVVISCSDRNRNCRTWARYGECYRSQGYMRTYCKKSCNVCT